MLAAADTLAFNPQSLDNLRFQAKTNGGQDAVRAAAQQFESYFLQMMLRNMRATLSQDSLMDSRETRMFNDMFDQQISQSIATSRGLGLADMLVKQLQMGAGESGEIVPPPRSFAFPPLTPSRPAAATVQSSSVDGTRLHAGNFVDTLWPHAVEAAEKLGVSPQFLLAQAALESGWGKHELRTANGGNSHNLFNIKAGKSWQGETVATDTTEYISGRPETQHAAFRAYGSYGEAFADYARLIRNNPRYANVVNQGSDAAGFAQGLQRGGYATDPMYADKILRILNSATFRNSLAAGTANVANLG